VRRGRRLPAAGLAALAVILGLRGWLAPAAPAGPVALAQAQVPPPGQVDEPGFALDLGSGQGAGLFPGWPDGEGPSGMSALAGAGAEAAGLEIPRPGGTEPAGGPPLDSVPLTLGLHLGSDPLRASAGMALAAELGAAAVPIEFAWERVQPAPGVFAWNDFDLAVRWARAVGLQPIGVFVYPARLPWPPAEGARLGWPAADRSDWLFFVQQVTARFAGAIAEWIVVQEEPPDADPLLWAREAVPYARLVQDTAAAIRAVQPHARVRAAANAADLLWLEVLVREGGLAGLDGLVVEANRWPAPPEGLAETIGAVRSLLHDFGYDPELWVWRFGYPTHIGVSGSLPHRRGVSEEQQAQYLARSIVALAQAGVGAIFYHELFDAGWERDVADSNFGLVRRDGQAKPAAAAYRTLAQQLGGRAYGLPGRVSPEDGDDAAVQAMGAVLAAMRERMRLGAAALARVAVHPFAGRPGDGLVLVMWSPVHPVESPLAVVPLAELALPVWIQVGVVDVYGRPLDRVPIAAAPVYLSIRTREFSGALPEDASDEGRGQ